MASLRLLSENLRDLKYALKMQCTRKCVKLSYVVVNYGFILVVYSEYYLQIELKTKKKIIEEDYCMKEENCPIIKL